jgi:anti-sigma factor RsiW
VTCRECAEFLADYVSGELTTEIRATFDRHLRLCPNCVSYMEQYTATIRAGKAACDDAAPGESPDIPEELIRAILAARSSRR